MSETKRTLWLLCGLWACVGGVGVLSWLLHDAIHWAVFGVVAAQGVWMTLKIGDYWADRLETSDEDQGELP